MCSREIDPKSESNFCPAAFNSGLFLEPVSTATINASLSRIVAVFGSPLAPCQTTTNKEKELTQTKIGHTHTHTRKDIGCVVSIVIVLLLLLLLVVGVWGLFLGGPEEHQIHGNGNQKGRESDAEVK